MSLPNSSGGGARQLGALFPHLTGSAGKAPVSGKSKAHGYAFGKTVTPAGLVAKKSGNHIESGSLRAFAEKGTQFLCYIPLVPSAEERLLLSCGVSIINESNNRVHSLLIGDVHAKLDRLIQSKSGAPSTTL